jgi:hypothetical protein
VGILILLLQLATSSALPPAESAAAANPLIAVKEDVSRVLADAGVPFTPEQESALVLMMEERRQASEELFGGLLDFRSGPTQGQEAERLRSAIEWLRNEFSTRLRTYLSEAQANVWTKHLAAASAATATAAQRPTQTQFVRINNNAFTAEDMVYRFGQGGGGQAPTEVIQRGGVGNFHGNAQFLFQDESLNARNPFAANKPPYQERRLSIDVGGPTIPGRLTTTITVSQNESENVDTVNALTPTGPFSLGITRPTRTRSFNLIDLLQLTDGNSLSATIHYGSTRNRNQNVGGFTLPERASESHAHDWDVDLGQFATLSSRSLHETRFIVSADHADTVPATAGARINVLDAFNSGGAQNEVTSDSRSYTLSNLFTRFGQRLTIKAGSVAILRTRASHSRVNFDGTFTFSTLNDFLAGRPINYRVSRGIPELETSQWEGSMFVQNDLRLNARLTLMYGIRYDVQEHLPDHNNFGPRVGFAYGAGQGLVLRGGVGLFHNRLSITTAEDQIRLDGVHQFELIVDSPSYPDPFQSGTIRTTLPSVRVTGPDLTAPEVATALILAERTLRPTLLVTASYDYQREYHRYRLRNLNAPYDLDAIVTPTSCTLATPANRCVRPDPARGNVYQLESSANEERHTLKLSVRQRFPVLTATAAYQLQQVRADSPPGSPDLPTDNYNLLIDWIGAHAGGFPRHSLTSTVNAQLPLGLFLTGVLTTNDGGYYNITTGLDNNRDGNVTDRPPGVPRNSGNRPKVLNVDFNVSKAFFLSRQTSSGTRRNVNVFANLTNAFNRLNPGAPSGVMTSPNFGKITSATNPRKIEIGLRAQF